MVGLSGEFEATTGPFACLVAAAQACRACASMEGRRRVLSQLNGPQDAAVMVLAEAPGRFGGDVSGRPLVDDASGRHFSSLLAEAGIGREQLFISNAVLCNPRDAGGRNRRPSRDELANCKPWLLRQIGVANPAVIVTLGAVALEALSSIEPHSYRLRAHVRRALPWYGRTLIPLYHPSPLTRAWRSDSQQVEDFRWLGRYLRRRGLQPRLESRKQ